MKKYPFLITENDKRHIMSLYGLLVEDEKNFTFEGTVEDKTPNSNGSNDPLPGVLCQILDENDKVIIKTLTTGDGNFSINAKLDETKKYKIKFSLNRFKESFYDIDFTKQDEFKSIKGFLEGAISNFEEALVEEKKGSSYRFFGTNFKINVKNSEDKEIKNSEIELYYGDNKVTLKSLKNEEEYFILEDLNKDIKSFLSPIVIGEGAKQKELEFNLKVIKNKISIDKKIILNVPTKILKIKCAIGAKKIESSQTSKNVTERFYYIEDKKEIRKGFIDGEVLDTSNITLTQTEENADYFINMLRKLKYTDLKYEPILKNNSNDYSESANKLKYEDFSNFGDKENTIDITLDTFIDFQISMLSEDGLSLGESQVKIYLDKDKQTLAINKNTDESGNINDFVDLINEEGDKILKKRTLWVEVTKEGYETYFEKVVITKNNNKQNIKLKKIEESVSEGIKIKVFNQFFKSVPNADVTVELWDSTLVGNYKTDNEGKITINGLGNIEKNVLYLTINKDGYKERIKKIKINKPNEKFNVKITKKVKVKIPNIKTDPKIDSDAGIAAFQSIDFAKAIDTAKYTGKKIFALIGVKGTTSTDTIYRMVRLSNNYINIYYDINTDKTKFSDLNVYADLDRYPAAVIFSYDEIKNSIVVDRKIVGFENLKNNINSIL
jgi:hypothetical protein